jgi:hypothetical protein
MGGFQLIAPNGPDQGLEEKALGDLWQVRILPTDVYMCAFWGRSRTTFVLVSGTMMFTTTLGCE